MRKAVGVVVVHGMGSFGVAKPGSVAAPSYSADLHRRVRLLLGPAAFDAGVAWREAFYSDLTEGNQAKYRRAIASKVSGGFLRDFVIDNLGDPASYGANPTDANNQVYPRVHGRIDEAVKRVERDVVAGGPLVVLAHSLGGHVVSNHIWDFQHRNRAWQPRFSALDRVAALVTFGCNIPLFTFAYRDADVDAIAFPGTALAPPHRLRRWWLNLFDRDDVLGYPLAERGRGYEALARAGALEDREVSVGGPFTGWNPLSHMAYWDDDDVAAPVAELLAALIAA